MRISSAQFVREGAIFVTVLCLLLGVVRGGEDFSRCRIGTLYISRVD